MSAPGSTIPSMKSSAPASAAGSGSRGWSISIPDSLPLGVTGTVVLALSSFSGGAVRNRGGLLEAANMGFLAFGHGRNVGMALFWVGMVLLIAAWARAGQDFVRLNPGREADAEDTAEGGKVGDEGTGGGAAAAPARSLRAVTIRMWAWVVPLLFAAPLASRDVYSYLMQGAMVRDGFDPYTEGASVNPGPFLLEVSQDWRNTTTPYGPLHLWMGQGVTTLVGDNVAAGVIAYKVISLIGFSAIAWAIPRIARELHGDPTLALWLGVANPVLLLHLIGGMHNESIMVGLVSCGLLLCLRHRFVAGIMLVAVAVALKATAFIALPFIVWIMVQHFAPEHTSSRTKQILVFLAAGVAAVLETIAVVAAITWASGSSWGWLSEITGNSKVINPLAAPTMLTDVIAPLWSIFDSQMHYNTILGFFRTVSMAVMLAGLVAVWWLFRRNHTTAIAGTFTACQVAFIFNSVTLPWYYASVLTLVGTVRPPRWLIQTTIAASVFVALSFSSDGNHQLYNWWWVLISAIISWLTVLWLCPRYKASA